MPEFQFRHGWQTDTCFYLLALKSCLMPLSPDDRYYEEFQRRFRSGMFRFTPRRYLFQNDRLWVGDVRSRARRRDEAGWWGSAVRHGAEFLSRDCSLCSRLYLLSGSG